MRKSGLFVFLGCVFVFSACAHKQAVKPEPPFNAEASFAKANSLFEHGRYQEARQIFDRIKAKDAAGALTPLATLRIADTYRKDGEPDSAVDEYRKFLQIYPDHEYAPYAQYQIAMIRFGQIKGYDRDGGAAGNALREFRNLMNLYPRNPYESSVSRCMSKCRYIMARHEFMVGRFYYRKKAFRGALGRFEGILENYPAFIRTPEVLYLAARSARALGDEKKAGLYLGRLRSRYPYSLFAAKANKEFAKR
ncbi:MAG: outer membrane protein assembly factor BamD [Nitrospiraceae bacterium]|nr:outer membrane protein assembly factor BamD [Nitrospiraceae bacterium]